MATTSSTVLALDVDGVLLDLDRAGDGHWTHVLRERFGIERSDLRDAFFAGAWDDVVCGRRDLEPALREALDALGSAAPVDDVVSCWFETDFVPVAAVVALARRASAAGHRVVLVTNQEHRRARYLRDRLGELMAIDDVVYSAELGVQKHERRFFELATEHMGADDVSTIVFADDAPEHVERAREIGWQAVLATPDLAWIAEVERLLGLAPADDPGVSAPAV